jgi:hypothetical protein
VLAILGVLWPILCQQSVESREIPTLHRSTDDNTLFGRPLI